MSAGDLTFDALRAANVRRCESAFHPVDDWSLMNWLGCVTGELGELASEIKRLRRGENVNPIRIAREGADVAIYLDLLLARHRVDLGAAIVDTFNTKSREIGSPVFLPPTGRQLAEFCPGSQQWVSSREFRAVHDFDGVLARCEECRTDQPLTTDSLIWKHYRGDAFDPNDGLPAGMPYMKRVGA